MENLRVRESAATSKCEELTATVESLRKACAVAEGSVAAQSSAFALLSEELANLKLVQSEKWLAERAGLCAELEIERAAAAAALGDAETANKILQRKITEVEDLEFNLKVWTTFSNLKSHLSTYLSSF